MDNAKKAIENFKFPTLCGVKCRVLPFNKQKLNNGYDNNLKKTSEGT